MLVRGGVVDDDEQRSFVVERSFSLGDPAARKWVKKTSRSTTTSP